MMQRVSLTSMQSKFPQLKSPLVQKDKPKSFDSKDGQVTIEKLPIYEVNKFAIKVAKKERQIVSTQIQKDMISDLQNKVKAKLASILESTQQDSLQ